MQLPQIREPARVTAINDYFAKPDDTGQIRASDIYAYDRLRVLTDSKDFIIPIIILVAAVLFFIGAKTAFGGPASRLRRLAALWIAAKERELEKRGREN